MAPPRGRKRGARRIRWDRVLGRALADRGPAGLEVDTEVELFETPPRLDHGLLLRTSAAPDDREPEILTGFRPHAPRALVTELKTVTGLYESRDLFRLDGKTNLYFADKCDRLHAPEELGMVLMVPAMNAPLAVDLDLKRWRLAPFGPGYNRIVGCRFAGFVIFLDVVAEAEQDDLLRCVSRHRIEDAQTADWLVTKGGVPETLAMANIGGFSMKLVNKALEDKAVRAEVLASPSLEERLAALADLPAEQAILALPPNVLRLLPRAAFAGLSEGGRRKIARKLRAKRR